MIFVLFFIIKNSVQQGSCPTIENRVFEQMGIGGGGAMSGFSISPWIDLWFVGTDMGQLYRSCMSDVDKPFWQAINHSETVFSGNLDNAVPPGFCFNEKTVLHASGGKNLQISTDYGVTWSEFTAFEQREDEIIRYFRTNPSLIPNVCLIVTNKGIYHSSNGLTWSLSNGIPSSKEPIGTFVGSNGHVFHATDTTIYRSVDFGANFNVFKTPSYGVSAFDGGESGKDLVTLAYINRNSNSDECQVSEIQNNCGETCVSSQESTEFECYTVRAGDHVKVSKVNQDVIYVAGSRNWGKQYGTEVWKSINRGKTWNKIFVQFDWDQAGKLWDTLEKSAVGLDVGYWDAGYRSFAIDPKSSDIIGGTGNFFLHITADGGNTWKSIFTEYKDIGERTEKKKWGSVGLEMTSCYTCQYHPNSNKDFYCGYADIQGIKTDDNGESFKILDHKYNSIYDFSFDDNDVMYAAMSSAHDFPNMWYGRVNYNFIGGVFKSYDKGDNFISLTPEEESEFRMSYLSVAIDKKNKILYAGTHGRGVAKFDLENPSSGWKWDNNGFFEGQGMIIPQIEIDPCTNDVYALLSWDSIIKDDQDYVTNREYSGIYVKKEGNDIWELLRGTVHPHIEGTRYQMWWKPIGFAVDWTNTSLLYLIDSEVKGSWLATGIWKSDNRGKNFTRKQQFTHPMSIKIDPTDTSKIHVVGHYSEGWGEGGIYYSDDYGETWVKNTNVFLQNNARSVMFDQQDPSKLFYTFFGAGILHGDNPIPSGISHYNFDICNGMGYTNGMNYWFLGIVILILYFF